MEKMRKIAPEAPGIPNNTPANESPIEHDTTVAIENNTNR